MSRYRQTDSLYDRVWNTTYKGNLPFSCDLEVTSRCNAKCVFCYRDTLPQRGDAISPEKFISFMDELKALGVFVLHITGGEPFLRQDIHNILLHAKKKGFEINITTNGTTPLGYELAEFLAENYITVKVSLHAPTAELHDRLTGLPGSFDKAVKFIKRLVELRARVSINMVLSKQNAGCLEEMTAFAAGLGVKRLSPTLLLLGKIDEAAANDELRLSTDEAVSAAVFMKKAKLAAPAKSQKFLLCNSGRNMFTMDPDGNIFPCNTLREPCGNILSSPMAGIWSSGPGFREVRNLREEDLVNCKGCESEPFCVRCLGETKARTGGYVQNTCKVCDLARIWHKADVLWGKNG